MFHKISPQRHKDTENKKFVKTQSVFKTKFLKSKLSTLTYVNISNISKPLCLCVSVVHELFKLINRSAKITKRIYALVKSFVKIRSLRSLIFTLPLHSNHLIRISFFVIL